MTSVKSIDITTVSSAPDGVYVGRDNGEATRKAIMQDKNINLMDKDIRVRFVFPRTAETITTSFFLGMLSQSIYNFKTKEDFLKHFQFDANEYLMEDIHQGIDDAFDSLD
ncbi:MAG: hypothetical protein LAT53_07340 [Idiomarina sp.]|nr:hypothetical protein [Idiomarina sp.]